jgi:xanthine dehydrogenase accessory factor
MQNIFSKIIELKNENKRFTFCIVTDTSGSTPRKAGAKMIVFEDGTVYESIGGGSVEKQVITESLEIMKTGTPLKKKYILEEDLKMHCGGMMEVYIEPVCPAQKLYIFGSGHIGKALARYASDFGFCVTLIDPRFEVINDPLLNGFEKVNEDYFTAIEKLTFDHETYSVIVTHKHEFDEDVLLKIALKSHAYIGMIGSLRKVDIIRKDILENKILPEEIVKNIDMPIGIKFAAESPAEIAISILAKLIDVKNKRYKNQS